MDELKRKNEALEQQVLQLKKNLEDQKTVLERDRGVERVRAEVMSMRGSDDLREVVVLMYQQIRHLGIDTPVCAIFFVNEDKNQITLYIAMDNLRKYGISWTNPSLVEWSEDIIVANHKIPLDSSWDQDLDQWRSGEPWSAVRTVEEDLEERKEAWELWGLDAPLPHVGPEWTLLGVPFPYGWVNIRFRGTTPECLNIVQELTTALSLGFVRYLDFERMEAQNKALEANLHQLRETQNQLVIQEKMASLGDLVAGVAHEMNTPLGAIGSMHDTLLRAIDKLKQTLATFPAEYKDHRTIQSVLTVIADANQVMASGAERVSRIVDSLRNFARLDEAQFQMADIHAGIDSVLTLLQNRLGERITVVKDYTLSNPVYCAPGQLNQVFMHLIKNAIEAIETTGQIEISSFEADNKAWVQISDTGVGIEPEHLERIFDFGFSDTGARMKMSLGLATDYRIIQDHKGEIKIDSELGKGTVVTISLPMGEQAPE